MTRDLYFSIYFENGINSFTLYPNWCMKFIALYVMKLFMKLDSEMLELEFKLTLDSIHE
jgi:hypothetical protein